MKEEAVIHKEDQYPSTLIKVMKLLLIELHNEHILEHSVTRLTISVNEVFFNVFKSQLNTITNTQFFNSIVSEMDTNFSSIILSRSLLGIQSIPFGVSIKKDDRITDFQEFRYFWQNLTSNGSLLRDLTDLDDIENSKLETIENVEGEYFSKSRQQRLNDGEPKWTESREYFPSKAERKVLTASGSADFLKSVFDKEIESKMRGKVIDEKSILNELAKEGRETLLRYMKGEFNFELEKGKDLDD